MRSVFVLSLVCSLAAGQETACAADADGGDDHCQLLQGNVGMVNRHEEEHAAHKKSTEHHDDHHKAAVAQEGWPGDILKKVAGAVGGVKQLETAFKEVETAVASFSTESHSTITALTTSINPSMTVDAIIAQVEQAELKLAAAAEKLFLAISKVSSAFLTGIGNVVPAQFKSAMKGTLDQVNAKGKQFAETFKTAAADLKSLSNKTLVCTHISTFLGNLHNKATALAASMTGLSSKGLQKEIKTAHDALPEAIKKEVDKVLHEANKAAESLMGSLPATVKEISTGVVTSFKGHCGTALDKYSGAGRLQVSLFTAFVISVAVSM